MCTIGSVFTTNYKYVFKQCDLIKPTQFIKPQITKGISDILYFPFLRAGSSGPWAGVNNYGVSFVAADSYLDQNNKLQMVNDTIFEAYTKIISENTSAQSAAAYMCKFYSTFNEPDILLIADNANIYFIETYKGLTECIPRKDGWFASTNHFRFLHGAVQYQNNHSTYLRLERAEKILQTSPDINGIYALLRDQYYGETVLSICRVDSQTPPGEQPYYTQATAAFVINGKKIGCMFQINGNPRNNPYTYADDIFGKMKLMEGLTPEELKKKITVG